MTDIIGIYDNETGESFTREMTLEEKSQRDIEISFYQEQATKQIEAVAEASAKRQALLDKLGITKEEAQLLLGGTK